MEGERRIRERRVGNEVYWMEGGWESGKEDE